MYNFLNDLLKDRTDVKVYSPYNIWHIMYIVLLLGSIAAVVFFCRNKSMDVKRKITEGTIGCAFALYMADFFIMPFSQGCIDIDKFPFHICTLTSILCFFSLHNSFLGKYKSTFTVIGFIGALIYIAYPAGVADGIVSVFCYRILQTLIFHGLVFAYGVLSVAFGFVEPELKNCRKDAVVILAITIWAIFGNLVYSGIDGRVFNWCFVSSDPLGIIPESIAKYVMPFVVFLIVFTMSLIIRLCVKLIRKKV